MLIDVNSPLYHLGWSQILLPVVILNKPLTVGIVDDETQVRGWSDTDDMLPDSLKWEGNSQQGQNASPVLVFIVVGHAADLLTTYWPSIELDWTIQQ